MTKEQRDYLNVMADALNRQRLTPFEQRCVRACLAELAAAEKVVEASRARFEVWTRETYAGLDDALANYDRVRGES